MQISEEILEKVKEQNDIVDIISENVKLKRSGRNFSGLCPFHNEKSPSFSVSQDKQIYKCFGCGESGNVITFIMKKRNMQFVDAVKYLADRANIAIETNQGKFSPKDQKRHLFYKVNVEAARFFFNNLRNSKDSKEYFLNRGIKEETIKRFGLGFAKDSWNSLIMHMKRLGYNDELLLEAGLASKSEKTGNIYDRFRNRVIFPVFDYRGKVIGFGGRVLDDSKPKYLNSPETLVFQKGVNLYGLNFALKNSIPDRYFIMVEGYMDVITLHQFGITNVVATLGTALTTNQARLLKRYADKVIISFDADIAGQTATLRGLDILREAGFDIRVLTIPQGKDPDEYIRSNGKEAFNKLINNAEGLIDYRIRKAAEGLNLKDSNNLVVYGKRVTSILADVNSLEKDIYIKRISEQTSIREQTLYDLLSKEMNKNTNFEHNRDYKANEVVNLYVEPPYVKAGRTLIKMYMEDEHFNYINQMITENELILPVQKEIFTVIKEAKLGNVSNVMSYLEASFTDIKVLEELVKIKENNTLIANNNKKLIEDLVGKIKNYRLNEELEALKKKQRSLEQEGKIEESIKIAIEMNKVNKQLKKGVK